jgi:hypothetical protein
VSVLPKMIVGVTVAGLLAFELASPGLSTTKVRAAAGDVAAAGAHKLFTDSQITPPIPFSKLVDDAHTAALAQAKAEKVTMSTFYVSTPNPGIHVTVSKTAVSLIFKHIPALRNYDGVTATASANPG